MEPATWEIKMIQRSAPETASFRRETAKVVQMVEAVAKKCDRQSHSRLRSLILEEQPAEFMRF